MTWGRYRRGRLRRSKFQRVREGTNLWQAGGTGSGPRAGIFRCESCCCSSSGARREQLRLLLDVKFVNPSLLDTPCLTWAGKIIICQRVRTQTMQTSAIYIGPHGILSAVHQPCKHRTRKFFFARTYAISKPIRISFLAVWNQRSLLVRGRRHHPNHHLLYPLHHAQDQGSWGQDFPTGEILQREREENKNRDFVWKWWSNTTSEHNMNWPFDIGTQ